MNHDELSDRLRRLIDRAHPVDLDEVTHRRPTRRNPRLLAALAGVAVLALVAGAVALLRIDRDDAAPVTTDPPPTTVTTPAPSTTTAPPRTTVPVGDVPQFVGVTSDGRLVVVEVSSGREVLELGRLGDPTAPHDPADGPGPNVIESVDVVPGSPSQVVYGDCCEPASGNLYAIGMDGSPTTATVVDDYDGNAYIGAGIAPAARADGQVAVASSGWLLNTFALPDADAHVIYDSADGDFATAPAWIDAPPYMLAYETQDTRGGLGLLTDDPDDPPVVYSPTGGVDWSDPVPVGMPGEQRQGVLVVESCCREPEEPPPASYETSVGRIIDPATGEVVHSIPFDGVVVDLDVSVAGGVLATFLDGRVATIDPFTGDSRVVAMGFTAAAW